MSEELEDVSSIKKILKTFPEKIKEHEEKTFASEIRKEELIAKKKVIESEVSYSVSEEKIKFDVEVKPDKRSMTKEEKENYKPVFKSEPKPRFTNDMQRENEANKRLLNNPDYNNYQKEIDKLSREISTAKIELSYLKRLNQNAGYLAVLGV